MASIYDVKPKFQALLRPISQSLHQAGVTPNMITWTALAGSFFVGAFSLNAFENPRWLLLLPVWFFLRMALNAIDGMIAREHNLKTISGAILNELGDILSDVVLFIPLAVIRMDAAAAILFFTMGAIVSEFCGVLGQALGGSRHYEGPMGKSDRVFLVGAIVLASVFFPSLMTHWAVIFWLGFGLIIWTCLNRISAILKELSHA